MKLKEISKPIAEDLKEYNKHFKTLLRSNVALLDLIVKYISNKKGKQARPVLVFLSAKLFGDVDKRAYTGAAMAELLHTATLVHDDVVDEADQRRGIATINAQWNNKIAVLIGDFLLAKGLLSAIDASEFSFLGAISNAVRRMSEGELLQIQKSKDSDIDEKTYFRIISDKTASLMAACCEIGAISTSNNPEHHKIMRDYGEFVGIAFQIRDDIFDFNIGSTITGKPTGNDLKEKKITLPLIHSFKKADRSETKNILKVIKNGDLKSKDIDRICDFVDEHGGLSYAELKAEEYKNKAIKLLDAFDESEAKTALINFADFVVQRKL